MIESKLSAVKGGARTAAMLLIGDEILSGRTADANLAHLAQRLGTRGIEVAEARVVRDVEAHIVDGVNALRHAYDHVFTTGGIGPTHDDITAGSIAKAFGVQLALHPEALARVQAQCEKHNLPLNEARKRMALLPQGASLIDNRISGAPGFLIGNVFVMAGVPLVMQVMLEAALPLLPQGGVWRSVTIEVNAGEGQIAGMLGSVQEAHAATRIGSYPFYEEKRFGVRLVIRSQDEAELAAAEASLREGLRAAEVSINENPAESAPPKDTPQGAR